MATTSTTLNGAMTASQTTLTLLSATGIAVNMLVVVDSEAMLVTDITNSPTLGVVRGFNNGPQSTSAVAHNTVAPIAYGLAADFANLPNGGVRLQQNFASYGAAGAVTIPSYDQTIVIDTTSAVALTLAVPAADNRARLTFTSQAFVAHTITCPSAIIAGSTAGLAKIITFAAEPGAGVTLQALAGKWNVLTPPSGSVAYSTS